MEARAAVTLPYPRSSQPLGAAPLYVASLRQISKQDQLTLGTLAGVLARSTPQLYTVSNAINDTDADADAFWLSRLASTTTKLRINTTLLDDFPALLVRFRQSLDGFVVYGDADSPNAALTACAASAGRVIVASAPSTVTMLRDRLKLPIVWNVSGLSPLQVFNAAQAAGRLSSRMAAFQPDDGSKAPHLAAYAAFGRLPMVEFPTGGSAAARAVMQSLTRAPRQLTAALGWTSWDEFQFVSRLAAVGAWAHASDWSDDLTALSNMPVHAGSHMHVGGAHARFGTPQHAPVAATARHTVAFLMSDGDNICWLQGGWRQAQWFGAGERGAVPLGWTFSPAAVELLPVVVAYAANKSTANDSFVGAPSAAGYTYPDLLPPERLEPIAEATAALMSRANMRLLNIIGSVPAAEPLEALAAREEIDGIFWYSYGDGYSGLRGNVAYVGGKPIIGGRVSLWGEGKTGDMIGVEALPAALAGLPTDPTDPNSYSLIPVNAWSHNYSDVVRAVRLLEAKGGFDVVSPAELVRRLTTQAGSRETC
jgi:lambda repressor-like predicted transcriptional regulator